MPTLTIRKTGRGPEGRPFFSRYRGRCAVTGKRFPRGTPIVKIEEKCYALADLSFVADPEWLASQTKSRKRAMKK